MTVKELIEMLKEYPEDMEVRYMNYRKVVTQMTEAHKEIVFGCTPGGEGEGDIYVGSPEKCGIDTKKYGDKIHWEKETCFLS